MVIIVLWPGITNASSKRGIFVIVFGAPPAGHGHKTAKLLKIYRTQTKSFRHSAGRKSKPSPPVPLWAFILASFPADGGGGAEKDFGEIN